MCFSDLNILWWFKSSIYSIAILQYLICWNNIVEWDIFVCWRTWYYRKASKMANMISKTFFSFYYYFFKGRLQFVHYTQLIIILIYDFHTLEQFKFMKKENKNILWQLFFSINKRHIIICHLLTLPENKQTNNNSNNKNK